MTIQSYLTNYRPALIISSVILFSLNALAILLLALVCLNSLAHSSSYNGDTLKTLTIIFISASGVSALLFGMTISSTLRQSNEATDLPGSKLFIAGLFITILNFIAYSFVLAMQFIS